MVYAHMAMLVELFMKREFSPLGTFLVFSFQNLKLTFSSCCRFGHFKSLKARFVGPVIPGQTLVTEMWRDGNKVTFQTRVKETGKLAMASAAAELV